MIRTFLATFFLFLSFSVQAQKIKYKDLYPMLSTKQYQAAEPLIDRFLKQEDPEHPNANFQKGIILHEKLQKLHPIIQRDSYTLVIDSAIYYYKQALKFIDDREIRKNDEYYQEYQRRDLRTGKFGINLSDVHLDIEQRIEGLQEQQEVSGQLAGIWEEIQRDYNRSSALIGQLKSKYVTNDKLILRSKDQVIDTLKEVAQMMESTEDNLRRLKEGYDGFSYRLEPYLYLSGSLDSLTRYLDQIEIQDYQRWSDSIRGEMELIRPALETLKQWKDDPSVDIEKSVSDLASFDKENFLNDFAQLRRWSINTYVFPEIVKKDSVAFAVVLDTLSTYRDQLIDENELIKSLEAKDFGVIRKDFGFLMPHYEKLSQDRKALLTDRINRLDSAEAFIKERKEYLVYPQDSMQYDTIRLADLNLIHVDTLFGQHVFYERISPDSVSMFTGTSFGYAINKKSYAINDSTAFGTFQSQCHDLMFTGFYNGDNVIVTTFREGHPGWVWTEIIPLETEGKQPTISCLGKSLIISDQDSIIRITEKGEVTD